MPSAVVSVLDELEELDAVERQADRNDLRRHAVAITARGRELLFASLEIAATLHLELLEGLERGQRRDFLATLRSVSVRAGVPGASGVRTG